MIYLKFHFEMIFNFLNSRLINWYDGLLVTDFVCCLLLLDLVLVDQIQNPGEELVTAIHDDDHADARHQGQQGPQEHGPVVHQEVVVRTLDKWMLPVSWSIVVVESNKLSDLAHHLLHIPNQFHLIRFHYQLI